MREVKFRGLDLMTGEWVYGKLLNSNFSSFIVMMVNTIGGDGISSLVYHQVDQESIGQYTGLIDIKGNQIYNADLIKDDENFLWEVINKQGAFYAKCDDLLAEQLLSSVNLFGTDIGNVYEHPELIEESL
ncbi:YopX family protein [Psychrobacillus antarcticus]|uniref:YopX family protein n=1 Tax=Psychrobacillus antarcticus TaxID=2879115 RepID=UPI0024088538|nr:YopX family protein [Psychrobacillus antarcticus]